MIYDHILIDGKNCAYRATYTSKNGGPKAENPTEIYIKFLAKYIRDFNPNRLHIFWDSSSKSVWRREIFEEYKKVESRSIEEDVKKSLYNSIDSVMKLLNKMNVSQYSVAGMEADDLIYAFCVANKLDKILIISNDGDLRQISYNYDNVDIYNPLRKIMEPKPEFDPVITKSLMGDKSDAINGYSMIGPVRAGQLSYDMKSKIKFINSEKAKTSINGEIVHAGSDLYYRNLMMIDLSLCPHLLDNIRYVENQMCKPTSFNMRDINKEVRKLKLNPKSKIYEYIIPFKKLGE